MKTIKIPHRQECIPVGCVPSAAVAVSPATPPHHVCPLPLPCMPLLPCTTPPRHTSPDTHALLPCTPPAMHTPTTHALHHAWIPAMHASCHACPLPHTPSHHTCLPPVDRMTDACENITFPQLLLRTVISKHRLLFTVTGHHGVPWIYSGTRMNHNYCFSLLDFIVHLYT